MNSEFHGSPIAAGQGVRGLNGRPNFAIRGLAKLLTRDLISEDHPPFNPGTSCPAAVGNP